MVLRGDDGYRIDSYSDCGVITSDRARPEVADLALVLAAIVVMVMGTIGVSRSSAPPDPVGWLLLVAAGGALWFRRPWPTAVMWIVIATGLAYDLLGNPGAFSTVAIVLAIFSVASSGRRWTAIAGVVATLATFYLTDLIGDTGHVLNAEGALWFGGWLIAGFLMGEVSRARIDRAAAAEQRAREAERHRQEETLRRASEERMRIARELHDVLAHSISIINVQAGVAAHHLDTDVDKARAALKTVRDTGKQALRELRSSLGVLRDSESDIEPPRAPSPGVSEIEHLIVATRHTGLTIHLRQHVDPDTIPPDVGLAVYRTIQESLTNVTRHADAGVVTVIIDQRPDELLLRVEDDGIGYDGELGGGHGIVGMRERLRALGGHLDAGPRPDGRGFRVEGRIPLDDGS